MAEKAFDIIIAGGGLSGLSLAWYLTDQGYKGNMLIADSTFAPVNDKTWCFWTNKHIPFRDIIYKKWSKSYLNILDYQGFHYLNDYTYQCIRSGDFKEYILYALKNRANITFLEENILDFSSNRNKAVLVTKSGDRYIADYIFQSIMKPKSLDEDQIKYPLIQHFYGLDIECTRPVFDPETFTMMDFDTSYTPGVAFMYILPWSGTRGLMEYTIFSEQPEPKEFYHQKIKEYLQDSYGLSEAEYTVHRTEYGEIPMEHRPLQSPDNRRIINLGMLGGHTKPSTGYTFMRIQEYTRELAAALIAGLTLPDPNISAKRFRFYDKLLLHILSNSTSDSHRIFRDLFRNNPIDEIFRFLSEDTRIHQDLKIMSSVPPIPFIKAVFHSL